MMRLEKVNTDSASWWEPASRKAGRSMRLVSSFWVPAGPDVSVAVMLAIFSMVCGYLELMLCFFPPTGLHVWCGGNCTTPTRSARRPC